MACLAALPWGSLASYLLPACSLCGLTSCLSAGCCAVSRTCCCALGAVSGGSGHISTRTAKAANILILALSSIFATVLYAYGSEIGWLSSVEVISALCSSGAPAGSSESQCVGASAALRVSLALAVFFAVTSLTAFSADFYAGCWGVKVLLWLGCLAGSFFVPASAIAGYGTASRVFSALFLLAMVVVLIDAAHAANEALRARWEAAQAELLTRYESVGCCQNCWKWLYNALVLALLVAALAGIGILYRFNADLPPGVTCNENSAFLSVTLVWGFALLVLASVPCTGQPGMLAPAIIVAYCTWLAWTAINSNADPSCSPTAGAIAGGGGGGGGGSQSTTQSIIGMVIAAVSLCYTAFSASRSLPHLFDKGGRHGDAGAGGRSNSSSSSSAAAAAEDEDGDAVAAGASSFAVAPRRAGAEAADEEERDDLSPLTGGGSGRAKSGRAPAGGAASDYDGSAPARGAGASKNGDLEDYSPTQSLVFMLIMCLAAMYMAPVLTNWAVDPSDVIGSRNSPASMWVPIASEWATLLLFTWTLIAPAVCPGRDFSRSS